MPRPPRSYFGVYLPLSLVRILTRHLHGALALGAVREFVMLRGPSGLGKTSIAEAIAIELKMPFSKLCMTAKTSAGAVTSFIEDAAKSGALIFLDELQELRIEAQMALVALIDDIVERSRAPDWKGAFCLVVATDRPQLILRPLRNRLSLHITLQPYSPKIMRRIVAARAADIQVLMTPQAQKMLAQVSRGSPRLAGQLLDRLKKYWAGVPLSEFTTHHVRRFLHIQGIDQQGLLLHDRQYLAFLRQAPEGLTLGVLATRLSMEPLEVAAEVEPYLIRTCMVNIRHGLRFLRPVSIENKE